MIRTETLYLYGCTHRPPMYGTVPSGYRIIEESTATHRWGVIGYEFRLKPEEVYRYELHPLSANTRRFQIGEHVDWCGDKCRVVKHYPMNGFIEIELVDVPEPCTVDVKETDPDLYPWGGA